MAEAAELHGSFSFIIQLGERTDAIFSECTLPTLEIDVLEQKEGGYNGGVHMLPGPVKPGRITLRRGVVKSNELLKWYAGVASGVLKDSRRNISVVMLDSRLQEIMRLNFVGAFPVKWTGPTFKTSDSAAAIETMELAFSEFSLK
jgi:phage tail-like protein